MEHIYTVHTNDAGTRIDVWLTKRLSGFSRNRIKELIDGGRVLVNRRRVVIAGWELDDGDNVEVRIPPGFDRQKQDEVVQPQANPKKAHDPIRTEARNIRDSIERHTNRQKKPVHQQRTDNSRRPHAKQEQKASFKKLKIYHEDRDLIVVEKPAGILSIPNDLKDDSPNMLNEVRAYMRRKHKGSKASFVAPLHRLDNETSGIMVFALSKNGQRLSQQFKNHSILRDYTAIVSGRIESDHGVIDTPLEKGDFHGGKKVRTAREGGMNAITKFKVKERYSNTTVIEVKVMTGRTHQIRVHLAEKGFPIIGDKLYNESDQSDMPRQALHAQHLGFKHPADGKKLNFFSPLPEDMKNYIDRLRTLA